MRGWIVEIHCEFCDTPRMVTKSIDKCIFNKPARESQLLKIYGSIETIGSTSITLKLEARSHNVYNGKQNVILATNITFVRIDEMGDPIPISDREGTKPNQMNNLDKQYKELLETILHYGVDKKDRTGTGTQSIFGYTIRHNMKDGFPLLTTKKVVFNTMVTD